MVKVTILEPTCLALQEGIKEHRCQLLVQYNWDPPDQPLQGSQQGSPQLQRQAARL
jgi:hypothetical protein